MIRFRWIHQWLCLNLREKRSMRPLKRPCRELNVPRDRKLEIEVLAAGSTGIFGTCGDQKGPGSRSYTGRRSTKKRRSPGRFRR